jgi:putative phage-type endonuclease
MNRDLQRTEEWRKARVGRVSGSNVGAIIGIAPYKKRKDVMREMVREYHGAPQEFTGNIATQWGEFNEDQARGEFEMFTGLKVKPCGYFPHSDWLGASPDGLIGKQSVFECKCPYGIRRGGEFKSIEQQPHYYAQVQIELLCTGRKYVHFWQWTSFGNKYEKVALNRAYLDEILPDLYRFWQEYQQEINNVEHLEPERIIVDTKKARGLVDEYDIIVEQLEALENKKKALLEEIVKASKEKNSIFCGRKLTKIERAGSIKYADVVKQHLPDLNLEPYRGKPTTFWKLG